MLKGEKKTREKYCKLQPGREVCYCSISDGGDDDLSWENKSYRRKNNDERSKIIRNCWTVDQVMLMKTLSALVLMHVRGKQPLYHSITCWVDCCLLILDVVETGCCCCTWSSHMYYTKEQMGKFHEILMESMLSCVVRRRISGRRIISFFEKVLFFLLPFIPSSFLAFSHMNSKRQEAAGEWLVFVWVKREKRTCVSAKIFLFKFLRKRMEKEVG